MEQIKSFIGKIKEKLAPYQKNIIEPLLKILAIIIICAIIAHMLNSGETLAEFAAKK